MTTFDEVLGLMPSPPTILIEPYLGSSGRGDLYGPAVTAQCWIDAKRQLVRAPNGSQVVSSSTALVHLGTACPPRSRVTLPDGQQTIVIAASRREAAGLPLPEHLEINLE